MSESEFYQIDGLEEDMQQLRTVRQKILELWLEVSDQEYATAEAGGVYDATLDMLRAASHHLETLTMFQSWAADPSTDTGRIEVTIQ